MAHLVLPLSTLYYEAEARARAELVPLCGELEIRDFGYGAIPEGLPLTYHSNFGAVLSDFKADIEKKGLFDQFRRRGVRCFTFDLGPACTDSLSVFPIVPALERDDILARMVEAVDWVRSRFDGDILLENLPFFGTGLYDHVCSPEFMAEVMEACDVGFLLDVVHAECSAGNMGIPFEEYLDQLPLNRVGQLHISKGFRNRFVSVDAHHCPDQREFEQVLDILGRMENGGRGVGVTIEYYRNIDKLVAGYRDLQKTLGKAGLLEEIGR